MQPISLIRLLVYSLIAFTPQVVSAQVAVSNFVRGSNTVTFKCQGGYGPYLVRTSNDLMNWSDQGDPATLTNWSLPAFAKKCYYRVTDLNASNLYGGSFGLIQTEQGEFGALMGRHRLKARLWLYKTKGAPHTSATYQAANYWRKLIVNFQTHWNGEVKTWAGPLENLGTVTTPGNAKNMTITWTNGAGPARRTFTLAFEFPYNVAANRNNSGATAPKTSDPTMTLSCTYDTDQPEIDDSSATLKLTTTRSDSTTLVQMSPGNPTNSSAMTQSYRVSANGVQVNLHHLDGFPLYEGQLPWILKTLMLDRWLSPTTAGGGSLPAFSTDSFFSRTILPGHHSFWEYVVIEPALEPALSEATRSALAAANIRFVYTYKDMNGDSSSDEIRYIGFNNTIRSP